MTDNLRRLAEATIEAFALWEATDFTDPALQTSLKEKRAAFDTVASPRTILGLLDSQRDWQEAAQEYERMLAIMVERHDRLRAALTALVEAVGAEPIRTPPPHANDRLTGAWIQARAALAAGEGG